MTVNFSPGEIETCSASRVENAVVNEQQKLEPGVATCHKVEVMGFDAGRPFRSEHNEITPLTVEQMCSCSRIGRRSVYLSSRVLNSRWIDKFDIQMVRIVLVTRALRGGSGRPLVRAQRCTVLQHLDWALATSHQCT